MFKASLLIKSLFLFLLVLNVKGQKNHSETWQGKLVVGKQDSAIIYYGSESGDMAAFCFRNESVVGRAILSKCKGGEQCKISGRISTDTTVCNTAYEYMSRLRLGGFSSTGEIVSLKSVKRINQK